MTKPPTWGIVSTIKAPDDDILNFVAYHLDLGADHIFVYLDEDASRARSALETHPLCTVILCDADYWQKRGKRPEAHQPRQTMNASHCYRRLAKVDWLAHIDVDEFICPLEGQTIGELLAQVPEDQIQARMRPIEALAPDPSSPLPEGQFWCKGCAAKAAPRRAQTEQLYPTYGAHLNGGFLSHVMGKAFIRTGLPNISLRIHRAYQNKEPLPLSHDLSDVRLIHCHAPDWDTWLNHFAYRIRKGSYRPEIGAKSPKDATKMTIHQLLMLIGNESGREGLRAFFDEVCVAHPDLREGLTQFGHLYQVQLSLADKRRHYFAI